MRRGTEQSEMSQKMLLFLSLPASQIFQYEIGILFLGVFLLLSGESWSITLAG